MKKFSKPVLFGVILLACLFVVGTGCKKKAECSGEIGLCDGHVFEACCTDTDCYYLVDGDDRYDCNGTNCVQAAEDLTWDYCGFSLKEKQGQDQIEKLLSAVK